MALVVVLSCLVFLAALVIAFMSSVRTELRSSKTYSDGVVGDVLSQTAFNLAITQITEATRGYNDPGRQRYATPAPDLERALAWASQPGMIRTWDAAGQPRESYRLYSWDTLRENGAINPAADAARLQGWAARTAHFTDLNQPLRVGAVEHYPILNPSALGVVEGFEVASAPGVAAANTVPMPVKWLYVLESGRVVAPTGTQDTVAEIPGASETDRVIGRVAFWTDDDCNKLNLNTAAEGSYVDMPRTASNYDRTVLAQNQPLTNEYQRYPGHPATTSLSTVFPYFQSRAEELYPLTPRYMPGGSKGGTVNTIASKTGLIPAAQMPGTGRNRLYASVDEFVFSPSRANNESLAINKDTLERTKFFLSAASRAPDTNLFNQPRVGIWPLSTSSDPNYRNATDELIAFCLTMRNDLATPYRYYFQRQNRGDATGDLANIQRNRDLLKYLRRLCGSAIPGFGGKFSTKYDASNGSGTDTDQILTEIFDYIRCTNLVDPRSDPRHGGTKPFKAFAPVQETGWNGNQQFSAIGQVIPIKDAATGTRGFGRFPTVSKGVLHVIAQGDNSTNSGIPAGHIRLGAAFYIELFDPSLGLVGLYPDLRFRVTGLNGFKWGPDGGATQGMGFPSPYTTDRPIAFAYTDEPFIGGLIPYNLPPMHRGWGGFSMFSTSINVPTATGVFDFQGGTVKVELLSYPDNQVVQTVYLDFPPLTGVQDMPLPQLIPDPGPGSVGPNNRRRQDGLPQTLDFWSFWERQRFRKVNGSWIDPRDVVRTVEAYPGDLRLLAARETVPATFFQPHRYYGDTTRRLAHSLRNGKGYAFPGATAGRLVGAPYRNYPSSGDQYADSAVTESYDFGNPSLTGVAVGQATPFGTNPSDIPGDWDNGMSRLRDGPYINKPDEGSNPADSPGELPYYDQEVIKHGANKITSGHFSPNRQMPSAVMFGSLPSGVIANRPWQTLLFRPDPSGLHPGGPGRKGDGSALAGAPADHLLLDLFHMPVVEPYAISEPLSTAGRVSMNYQIAPFTYITRNTGIRAVLKSEKIIAIPDSAAADYKQSGSTGSNYRLDIDPAETLAGFQQRFQAGELFKSPSEICEIHLVPRGLGLKYSDMSTFWNTRRLTGDNSRERPYATIYPRLTTRSNVYTIHVRVQALQKRRGNGSAEDRWEEGKDLVVSEYRGYQTVERFIDPNGVPASGKPALPDYADLAGPQLPLSDFTKIRVLAAKQFSP
jgi:hypothetical protein